ncbi:copper transporter [Ornithinimicrobium pekingense]|uniref:Copper transporter n=1 Tax=Ornithinimicrobium pekingense TaxID=384677 RepID=A0ABQ2F9D8_9MICO|nr:copper transporter [Ornithinimicrobium pekingense]GGK74002.1 hypothetical protein GCM10011509_23290 [Ornithinimicrobium pekingense]
MIDFRYHVVSLVAVFIALAVGIVLGAGPLREGLSSTLESEVGQLRQERTDLRGEVDVANQRAEAREAALGRLAGPALERTLEGVRVGVVIFPGADRNTLEQLERQVGRAGGRVTLTAEVTEAWASPTPDDGLLGDLALTLEVPEPRNGELPTTATVMAAVLAGADQPGQLGAWLGAGAELEDAGLVEFTWRGGTADEFTDRRPPDALLVVDGDLDAAQAQEPDGEQDLVTRLDLVDALADLDVPLVVTGAGTEERAAEGEDNLDPLVAAVRSDRGLADQVSTVDNIEHLSGQLAAALALAWQLEDEVGHYGLGRLAEAPVPTVPPAREGTVSVPLPQNGTPGAGEQDDTGSGEGSDPGDPAQSTAAP